MRAGIEAVLFDLDGTLADTAADLIAAVWAVCDAERVARPPFAALRPQVSQGGRALLAVAFPERDTDQRDALLPAFLDHYRASVCHHTRPFDGVEPLLQRLHHRGLPWGIVTNKPEGLARAVVAGLAWTARCAVLVGGDTLPVRKPAPEPLWHAAKMISVDPARCLYVGDDRRDIDAACAAGMPVVAALWGYRADHDDPMGWPATHHAEDADGLARWLDLLP